MFTFEVWSSVDQRMNASLDHFKSRKAAEKALTKYLAIALGDGWETHGRTLELEIRDGGLREKA